ncbi:MAG: LolA-related protein [Parazoarcus communis]
MIRYCVAFLLSIGLSVTHAAEWGVDQLMRTLADNGGGRVRFVETRYLAILEQPLTATGELVYIAPARLERHTETPVKETMVLDGDTLTLNREGKTHTLRLRDYPEVAALIDSIRATLAGDQQRLARSYALSVGGQASRWQLDLLPSDPGISKVVSRIRIGGRHGAVNEVEILQADGDRSVMSITPK